MGETTYPDVQRVIEGARDAITVKRVFGDAYEKDGITVIPAATDYAGQRPFTAYELVPGPKSLRLSHLSLREWISRGYYMLLGS